MPLHMLGLQPTAHLCCTPVGSTRLRSLRRPDSSHSAGLVTISVNESDSPLSYDAELMVGTGAADSSTNLKDCRDEHGVGIGKAEKGGLGIRSFLEVFNGPNHCGMLYRGVNETARVLGSDASTNEGHSSQCGLNLISCSTSSVELSERHRATATLQRTSRGVARDEITQDQSTAPCLPGPPSSCADRWH